MYTKRILSIPLIIWGGITFFVLVSILFIGMRWGSQGFEVFIQDWPLSHLPTTLASVAITWLLGGFFTYLLAARRFNEGNVLTWTGFFLIGVNYLNVLRERFRYGDIDYYIQAAKRLLKNQPLPDTYFYPPLWATLLKFILPLGEEGVLLVAWIFNILAVFAFYFLLHRVLERYGFSPRLAALATAGFMFVNTPLLRTLVYVQVNLHTMNAIFLSLLLFRQSPFISALMMALAVQLKTSPAVLVLAFLLTLDWQWIVWFVVNNLLVASLTFFTDGISPFLDFLHNCTTLLSERNAIFHDTSFDSLFSFPTQVFAFPDPLARVLIYGAKGTLLILTVLLIVKTIRKNVFFSGINPGEGKIYNAILPLFILMTLACPIVWEHHGIFLSLSFLVLLKKMDSPTSWTFFGFAYFFEFLLPTFDFYPWSYGRLVAPLVVLALMWKLPDKPSELFEKANRWVEAFHLSFRVTVGSEESQRGVRETLHYGQGDTMSISSGESHAI